jgi:catechol 2,3-dioxygenase-like lactoylglutathione lyase family enzyme
LASRIETLTIDCADPKRVADFWCAALGFELKDIDEEGAEIVDPVGDAPPLLFLIVPERKSAKNRLHLDLRPPHSMAEEVERLRAAGATEQLYVEEGGSYWTVMLDPEGNEFCVLRGPKDGWSPDA